MLKALDIVVPVEPNCLLKKTKQDHKNNTEACGAHSRLFLLVVVGMSFFLFVGVDVLSLSGEHVPHKNLVLLSTYLDTCGELESLRLYAEKHRRGLQHVACVLV